MEFITLEIGKSQRWTQASSISSFWSEARPFPRWLGLSVSARCCDHTRSEGQHLPGLVSEQLLSFVLANAQISVKIRVFSRSPRVLTSSSTPSLQCWHQQLSSFQVRSPSTQHRGLLTGKLPSFHKLNEDENQLSHLICDKYLRLTQLPQLQSPSG